MNDSNSRMMGAGVNFSVSLRANIISANITFTSCINHTLT